MKKYIKQFCVVVVCFGVLVQQIMPVNAIAASKKNVVKKEYKNFLAEKNILWSDHYTTDSGIKFRVDDLNADGIAELLIYDEGASNAQGQLAIYTYCNGKIKYIESYPLWKVVFYKNKKGLVYSEVTRDGYYGRYEVFDGDSIKVKYTCEGWYDENFKLKDIGYYNAERQKIEDNKAKSAISKLKRNAKKVAISEGAKNMYKNNIKNRKKYL